MPKKRRQTIASLREKMLVADSAREVSRIRTIRAVEIKRRSGSSLETVSFLTRIGLIRAAMPIRRSTFTILLPITLPSKISVLPEIKEEKETASSGAPVPKATIVRPIKSLLILKFEATEEAPSTSQSAPLMRKMNPMIRMRICKMISMFISFMFI